MNIMISGASGFVGRDIVQNLSKSNKIIAIYRTKNKNLKESKNITWIKHDLKDQFKKKLKPIPKVIIHCVAAHELSKKKSSQDYFESNVISLKNIIDYAENNKINMIINLSTVSVYGTIEKNVLKENYQPRKQNLLGMTKLLAEKMLNEQKVNYVNIRLPGILCIPNVRNMLRPWLNQVFNRIYNNQKVQVYNLRGKFNNVIDTDEITNFIEFLINKKIKIRDTFNFACSKPIILNQVLKIAKSKLKSKSKIIEVKDKKNNSFIISTKKLEKKLNYKTQSTDRTIRKYLENFI